MANARVGIQVDSAGVAKFMKSPELGSFLQEVAEDVAAAAGGGYEIEVTYDRRTTRVISMVKSNDQTREIETGALARAVGAKETTWV